MLKSIGFRIGVKFTILLASGLGCAIGLAHLVHAAPLSLEELSKDDEFIEILENIEKEQTQQKVNLQKGASIEDEPIIIDTSDGDEQIRRNNEAAAAALIQGLKEQDERDRTRAIESGQGVIIIE